MNQYKYGFAELHAAFVDETDSTKYGEVFSIPNVLSITLDPDESSNPVYGDDSKIATISTNNGYTGSVEADVFDDEFIATALGWYKDANGKWVEVADGKPRHFALGYRIQGDAKNRRTWLYDVQLSRPSKSANGVQDSVTPDTDSLDLTVVPKYFADIDKKVVSTWCYEGDTEYDNFFEDVVAPAAEQTTGKTTTTKASE
jgi:phi13 family phage major tail protein